MLPPGHLAAAYLLSDYLLTHLHPALSPGQIHKLVFWGTFFGFAPDLDSFYAFYQAKGFTITGSKINHRKFISHRPLLWLAAGLLIYFFAWTTFVKYIGLLLWLCSWSHFVLDSFWVGVEWLWPFNSKFYALKEPGVIHENNTKGFFNYWIAFLKLYSTKGRLTFYVEIILLILVAAKIVFNF